MLAGLHDNLTSVHYLDHDLKRTSRVMDTLEQADMFMRWGWPCLQCVCVCVWNTVFALLVSLPLA